MGRNPAFRVALVVATLFHVSMVTLFSIQIPFIRKPVYFQE